MPIKSPGQGSYDARYLKLTGGTMTGDEIFPANGYIMTDSGGVQWRVTVDTTGHLVTTKITAGASVWLSLGLANMP